MGEDNDFNVQVMITRLMWTIWTSLSAVRERPLNLITHSSLNDRESSRDKANMGNHKANRGFLPSIVNRSSAVCSMLTRTPISSY